MIAVVGGMQRSGSTFSFNVLREVLEARGRVVSIPTNSLDEALREAGDCDHLIIKTHGPDGTIRALVEKGALPCVCTIRKPEDAIGSWMSTFGFQLDDSIRAMRDWIGWHRAVCHRVLNISYTDIEQAPLLTAWRIGRYFAENIGVREVVKIWAAYRKERVFDATREMLPEQDGVRKLTFSYYDQRTFFHRRHVSAIRARTARDTLDESQIELIRRQLAEFVDSDGEYRWEGLV